MMECFIPMLLLLGFVFQPRKVAKLIKCSYKTKLLSAV